LLHGVLVRRAARAMWDCASWVCATLIASDSSVPYRVVGFIDDARSKRNLRLLGVPVLKCRQNLVQAAEAHQASMVRPSHHGHLRRVRASDRGPGRQGRPAVEVAFASVYSEDRRIDPLRPAFRRRPEVIPWAAAKTSQLTYRRLLVADGRTRQRFDAEAR
jgi:hypothetical protein